MANTRTRWAVAGIIALFFGLAATVVAVRLSGAISGQMALLMLVGLIGLYIGFGILFAVYRFVRDLE